MLFTRTPNSSAQNISPIASLLVSVFSSPQSQPPRFTLLENYNPQSTAGRLPSQIIADEFEEYKSAGRTYKTPCYCIIETAGDRTRMRLCYKLRDIRTLKGREVCFGQQELRALFIRRGIGRRDGDREGGRNQLVAKDWVTQT